MRALILTAIYLSLASCASLEVFELPKVQRNFAENLVRSEGIVQKAVNDYREKKALFDNLAKSNSSSFRAAEKELAANLRRMFDLVEEINSQKKQMTEASGDIASLSYQRGKIYSDDKAYPMVNDAVKRFETAGTALNQSLLDYSRESNSMADLIADRKLYFTFDVAEFQKRAQKTILASQENQKLMQKEIARASITLDNWNKPDSRPEQEKIFAEMQQTASDYSVQAQTLSTISKDMQSTTAGSAKISTLDPHWPEVQKLITDLDMADRELSNLNEKFQRKVETFKNPSKRAL